MSPVGRMEALKRQGGMHGLDLRDELLFGLTPAEWWTWCYLVKLAHEQGSYHVILPRPGEDGRAEKIFGRKHIKNMLKALKAKRHLTLIVIPRSKNKQIEVFLPASKIGELQFPNVEKGYLQFPNKGTLGNPSSAKTALGNCDSPISEVIQATFPDLPPAQAKLKSYLQELVKLKQGDLKGEIKRLRPEVAQQILFMARQIAQVEPRSRKLSLQVRLFAVIRYIQEGQVDKPQAWVDNVARAEERKWKGASSGESGRSQFPGESGSRLTSSSARR